MVRPKMKSGSGSRCSPNRVRSAAPALLPLCLVIALSYIYGSGKRGGDGANDADNSVKAAVSPSADPPSAGDAILRPTRIRGDDGLDVLCQFPPERECSDLGGVLFLYHGCGRSAASFFYSPQGRDMMIQSLQRGFVVAAFEKPSACWLGSDLEPTVDAGLRWLETDLSSQHCGGRKDAVENLPVFGFGASSGGSFVASVAESGERTARLNLSASNVQIMAPRQVPTRPTIFTVMSRDAGTKARVEKMVSEMQRKGTPTKLLETAPKAITAEYFVMRFGPEMKDEVAKSICDDLAQGGIISADDGRLVVDPRSKQSTLMRIAERYSGDAVPGDSGAYGVGPELWEVLTQEEREDARTLWLLEEMNVGYDQHEITAEFWDEVLAFFLENAASGRKAIS